MTASLPVTRQPLPDLRSLSWEELDALGLCECGVALDVHPPLPKPKEWPEGRPCAKGALERGHGWDGTERTKEPTEGHRRRWEAKVPDPEKRRPYRPFTDEHKARLSAAMRDTWARRKAAQA